MDCTMVRAYSRRPSGRMSYRMRAPRAVSPAGATPCAKCNVGGGAGHAARQLLRCVRPNESWRIADAHAVPQRAQRLGRPWPRSAPATNSSSPPSSGSATAEAWKDRGGRSAMAPLLCISAQPCSVARCGGGRRSRGPSCTSVVAGKRLPSAREGRCSVLSARRAKGGREGQSKGLRRSKD